MDIASIIGILSGLALIVASIFMGGDLGIFINVPSMMIVGGGTIAATLIAYPLKEVIGVFKIFMKVFITRKEDVGQLIKQLAGYAQLAKQQGVLALEAECKKVKNPLLQQGLQMISDGMPKSTIVKILTGEISTMQERHRVGREIFLEMGKFAPAFGMIGTLIGLVQMLASLNDPSTIGPKMAVALITTFYGAFLANLVFLPMATKLKRRSQLETIEIKLIIEGLLGITEGENPKILVDRLKVFLDKQLRQQLEVSGGKGSSKKAA
ncbi:MAG: motility protein A [Calditrichaeota bacterium]|nr:MAG: motility protein A [Calditrichota bacterium]